MTDKPIFLEQVLVTYPYKFMIFMVMKSTVVEPGGGLCGYNISIISLTFNYTQYSFHKRYFCWYSQASF
jgi:hypothetical protein